MSSGGSKEDSETRDGLNLGPLQALIARLRAPDGCPWDREQTLDSVRAYLLEEAHETAAAIDSGDREALVEELGDLLFQLVFVGHLAEEEGAFTLARVAEEIHAKMVTRHPHVFGSESLATAREVAEAWEARKIRQREAVDTGPARSPESILEGVPTSLPALTGA
ncbi:MAG: hypothetical protein MI919_37660, partial [Holophagales bacterium]|nr:hypothetical protein [Holophagales bacterium]